jgi:cytochrome b
MSSTRQTTRIAVWDPVVRYGHWALVVAFAVAYLSGDDDEGGVELLHAWSGYAVGTILAVRVLWGLVGTRYARFSNFAYGPRAALRYLNDLVRGHARRYIGHSPAGGAMIIALLVCLAGTVGTGLVVYGDHGKGPLADAGVAVIAQAHAGEHEGGRQGGSERNGGLTESALGELHAMLANITLLLITFHILGVVATSLIHRENLVAAMINGEKRAEDEEVGTTEQAAGSDR